MVSDRARRVIAQQWISVDGYAAGPADEQETFAAVEDFTDKGFAPVLDDPDPRDAAAVRRVVLTAGKVHYNLLAARRKDDDGTTALVIYAWIQPG